MIGRLEKTANIDYRPSVTVPHDKGSHGAMTDAFVHVIVEPSAISQAADTIADVDSVSQVHLVTGEYDIVAQLDVASKDDIADAVTEDILPVSGVIETVTHVAFEP